MRHLKISLLFLLLFFTTIQANELFYISPGVTLTFNSNSKFMLGWKLSLGYSKIDVNYVNVTIGNQFALGKNPTSPEKVSYLEIQAGKFNNEAIIFGAGAGISLIEEKVHPRVSLCYGSGVFLTADYSIGRNLLNGGFELAMPLPIGKPVRAIINQ